MVQRNFSANPGQNLWDKNQESPADGMEGNQLPLPVTAHPCSRPGGVSWAGLTWRRQGGSLEVCPRQQQPGAQLAPAGWDGLPRAGTLRWMWHRIPGVCGASHCSHQHRHWKTFPRAELAGHLSSSGRWLGNNEINRICCDRVWVWFQLCRDLGCSANWIYPDFGYSAIRHGKC